MGRTDRAVTICFHGIGVPGRTPEPGEERFWVDRSRFVDILDVIREHGDRVELTFDDGNESDHRHGLPELLARGLRAEFFVIAGRLDEAGSLSRSQLGDLHRSGMPVGNHGLRHRPWREVVADAELEHEVGEGARLIEEVVGERPAHAACPRGSYDRRVLRLLRRHGYRRVYTVDEGSSPRRAWLRNRYSVIHTDTPESVLRRIEFPDGTRADRARRAAAQLAKRWR